MIQSHCNSWRGFVLQDYETCVLTGDRECSYKEGDERPDFAQLTEFFCGQEKKCT